MAGISEACLLPRRLHHEYQWYCYSCLVAHKLRILIGKADQRPESESLMPPTEGHEQRKCSLSRSQALLS